MNEQYLQDCDKKILLKTMCNNIQDSKTTKIAPKQHKTTSNNKWMNIIICKEEA